ncbi:alpha/beta hydrolase [Tumebacillus permanentifrigoris]|uniref:Putative alpha/beta superfamily hydrolase n=1 Tax=Tumebacillus permanentifrigoris TaxID=378543 RepID=A0A316D5S0_9BACL|nr:alpha/beta hydrolase-fold protein [Tumebacillus permanentifrigoris]PWK09020.1 putative alpha/beta superfamily hydrolase [Tumebacillus permanentifrigoris]
MIQKFLFSIPAFNQERMIRVYVPNNYHQTDIRYPVLYMHDGQNVFQDEEAFGGVSLGLEDFLERTGLAVIVVAIDRHMSHEERINEYCPWVNGDYSKTILGSTCPLGGKGEAYVDFIVHELKPHIDRTYRTLADRSSMAGFSLGGLISTYAACRYPHIFQRVAVMSSGFYRNQEEIEQLVSLSDLSAIEKFYLDFGTDEAGEDAEISQVFVKSNLSVYHLLETKIGCTEFQIIEGGRHNYTEFRNRVPQIFSFLF